MSARRGLARAALVLALAASPALADDCINLPEDRVTDEIVVELREGSDFLAFCRRWGCTDLDWIPQISVGLVRTPAGADLDQLTRDMESTDDEVKDADAHRRIEDPEGVQRTIGDILPTGTRVDYLSQPAVTLTHAPQAQLSFTGRAVTVAVLDTGVSSTNAELALALLGPGMSMLRGETVADVPPNGIDDDGDGLTDEAAGHGTHVAGLVHLIAPSARILPIRVLNDDGKESSFPLARGIIAAADANVDIINLSLGLPHDARAVEAAIEYAATRNVVVIAAAGNRGLQCVDFPADRDEVIAVAAVDDAFVKTPWSSCGLEVALSAPGVRTISTHEGDVWAAWDGTSFATPLVTGAAALLLEKYPGLLPAELKAVLKLCIQPDANPDLVGKMGDGVLDLALVADVVLPERESVRVDDDISWSPVSGATRYDVARGRCSSLSRAGGTISLGTLTCIADDVPHGTRVVDPTPPPPGDAFFYVVRDDAPDIDGHSWGRSSDGRVREGASDCTP